YAPAGTVTVDGTLDGIPISASSATAPGGRNYADAALATLTSVLVALVDENVDVQLELAAGGLAVGALAVPGDVAVEVLYRDDDAVVSATATGGTVTVTRYDGTGIAGTYSLTTAAGTIT